MLIRKIHVQLSENQSAWFPFLLLTLVISVGCARVSTEPDLTPLQTVTSVDLTRYAGT